MIAIIENTTFHESFLFLHQIVTVLSFVVGSLWNWRMQSMATSGSILMVLLHLVLSHSGWELGAEWSNQECPLTGLVSQLHEGVRLHDWEFLRVGPSLPF